MQRETYVTIAAIAICQLMRIGEDTLNFALPRDNKSLDHSLSIYLFVASQFGFYSILLYYTYQMQIIYDHVHEG
jgi:hypothetical protein